MNAYELADELLRDNTQLTVKAAHMLRQQADRIAVLENPIMQAIGMAFEKPLDDEEIIKIRQMVKAKSTSNWADTFAFARAIEERHGIK